jgi:hypothetical protein
VIKFSQDEAQRARQSRERQRLATEKELRRKTRIREAKEAQRFSNPLSGTPGKAKKLRRGSSGESMEYWKRRALVAESALRSIGQAPAAGPSFYESREWRTLRYKALKLHGRKCQLCGATDNLHVDHIKPRSRYPQFELVLENLQILCVNCNVGKGAWDDTDWRKSIPGD